jgi:hypothetical protein
MAIQVGIGLSTAKEHIQAANEAAGQAKKNIRSERIDFAIVFSSVEFAHSGVLKAIANSLGPIPILGCSSLAIITNQGISKYGLVIMLFGLPEGVNVNVAFTKDSGTKSILGAGEDLGEKLLSRFQDSRRDLAIMFSDGLIPDGSELISGLQERLGASFPLVGASASDNLAFKKTFLYFNQEVFTEGACGLLWGGRLNYGLGIKHGWKPLGKPRSVTRSKGNVVEEIEGAPAVNIYKEYFAKDISELRKDLKRISIFYPIGIYLTGEEEYLLRNIMSIENNGSLVFQGNVPLDSQIRLMIGTKESCLAATSHAAQEAKKGLLGRPANFVFVFDSVSRYILLGRQADEELKIIKNELGKDIPIVGIYTYGEQAPLRAISYMGKTYFHNQTIVVLGMTA